MYKHAPTEDAAAVLAGSLPEVGVDPAVLTSGQVQLADTTALRARTGGGHEALLALHRHQLGEATRAGFAGLALTGDAAAMLTITCDERELAGYERGLERLAVEEGVRSLCRYTADQRQALLDDMLAVHHRDVADDVWSVEVAVVDGDRRLRCSRGAGLQQRRSVRAGGSRCSSAPESVPWTHPSWCSAMSQGSVRWSRPPTPFRRMRCR